MSRDLFPMLEPPSGGLAELRTRVQAEQRRTARLPRWALAATAVAAIAIVPWLTRDAPLLLDLSSASAAAKFGLAPNSLAPVTVPGDVRADVSVSPMESRSNDVIYYWVASTRPSRYQSGAMEPAATSSP